MQIECDHCTLHYLSMSHLRLITEGSLRADAWALRKIAEYQGGKLLMWTWLSRGLTTIEQQAEWNFEGNVDEASRALEATPGALAELCQLQEVPELDCSAEKEEIAKAASITLDGEFTSVWAICDSSTESQPICLPTWFRGPIDKAILTWQEEHRRWEEKKASRLRAGHSSLPPKLQEAYNEWSGDPSKTIVLSKQTQGQVVNISKKPLGTLKKTCVMIKVHMSQKADELSIQAGDGKLWQLKMLEGVVPPSDAVPAEIDKFGGLSF